MTVARDELLETERERVTRQFEAGGSLGLSPAEKVERLSQLRRAKVYLSLTASRRKPPRSPASHNLLKPCPSLARWSGSRRRRTRAEPSGGIVYEPANTPQCPECSGNPRLLCRGTSSSNPSPSSEESCELQYRRRSDPHSRGRISHQPRSSCPSGCADRCLPPPRINLTYYHYPLFPQSAFNQRRIQAAIMPRCGFRRHPRAPHVHCLDQSSHASRAQTHGIQEATIAVAP